MSKYIKEVLARLEDLKTEEELCVRSEKMSGIVKDTLNNLEESGHMQVAGSIDLEISMSSLYYHVFSVMMVLIKTSMI